MWQKIFTIKIKIDKSHLRVSMSELIKCSEMLKSNYTVITLQCLLNYTNKQVLLLSLFTFIKDITS